MKLNKFYMAGLNSVVEYHNEGIDTVNYFLGCEENEIHTLGELYGMNYLNWKMDRYGEELNKAVKENNADEIEWYKGCIAGIQAIIMGIEK